MRNLYEIPILLYETTRDWGQRSGLSERLPERAKEKEEIKKMLFPENTATLPPPLYLKGFRGGSRWQ